MPLTRQQVEERLQACVARSQTVGYDYDAQPKSPLTDCPLCGCQQWTPAASADRYGLAVDFECCEACGFVFNACPMTREAYGDFYARWYRPLVHAFSDQQQTEQELAEQQLLYARFVRETAMHFLQHPTRRTLLDVGGSMGAFAQLLHSRWGYQCSVLDPCPSELAWAERIGAKTIAGFVEDHETDERFDVVSMIQTADHLLDPAAAFRKCRKWLSPHGVFIVDFVDYTCLERAFCTQMALKVDHPSNFTAVTAEMLLARTGFEPLNIYATPDKRHLLYICRPVPALPDYLPPHEVVADRLAHYRKQESLCVS